MATSNSTPNYTILTDVIWSVGDIVNLIEAREVLEDGSLLVG